MAGAGNNPGSKGPGRGLRKAPATGDIVARVKRGRQQDEEIDEGPSADDIERFGDVTRRCPECNKDVFDDTAICYHCGHAFERTRAGSPSKNKLWVVITVVVIIIVFVAVYVL